MQTEITAKARFDRIRYAQLWEDADVLTNTLGWRAGASLVSIGSAGDNALAMLTLDPARVLVYDVSPAQLACLRVRIAAMRRLEHNEYLELLGARPSDRRRDLLDRATTALSSDDRVFWRTRSRSVDRFGLGGVGKLERYFRLFRRFVLPFAHRQTTVDSLLRPRAPEERVAFLEKRWSNWRWRMLLALFFSRQSMGALGRDPAFFAEVRGSVPAHIARRLRHAAVDLDPSANPYLWWILKGRHADALPMPWRLAHYDVIRSRLDRLVIRSGPIEQAAADGVRADGFNLSDIFEYMSPTAFERAYGEILRASNPGARLVYWNMMVPRRAPNKHALCVVRRRDLEDVGKAADKAFFYSDFVVEDVIRQKAPPQ